MPTKVEQINPDGTIVLDYDPEKVVFSDQQDIISTALDQRGWSVEFEEVEASKLLHRFRLSKGGVSFSVAAYIFPNFAWGGNTRKYSEKRIQITKDYKEHQSHFILDKDGDPRCALMGVYRRDNTIIFSAWDAAAYKDHAPTTSCYVHTRAMSAAVRSGFGQHIDKKNRVVCCFTPDMLAYYLENMKFLHQTVVVSDIATVSDFENTDADIENTSRLEIELPVDPSNLPSSLPHNRIIYGAPGTGKSHRLNEDLLKYFPSDALYERTTFYPDMTNGVFVGEYRPVPVYRRGGVHLIGADRKTPQDDLEPIIDYRFVPGPFLRMLVRAINHPDHSFALVIEEINRAHASSVFGEIFQLLDRGDDGTGRFSVALAPAAQDYLFSQGVSGAVRIPKNLYIWATMNSADQGVLPMDGAFRRRWSLEYVGIDEGEAVIDDWEIKLEFLDNPIKWNVLRKAINKKLQSEGVGEDRLIGPFFMTKKELASGAAFENKLLQYLRDDVVRSSPGKLFAGHSLTYGALVSQYKSGQSIFVADLDLGENG